MALKTPELALDHREAETLADAIATVSAHYDVDAVIPPEALAWVNLAQVAGFIYGPRIFAARMRKANARADNARDTGDTGHGQGFDPRFQGFPAH